jgi:DNA-binding response OmpR family regulator
VRVLVVEDDRPLADAIARGLRRDAFAVDLAHDGAVALRKASIVDYDVIVLDRDLPVVHGDDVCRELGGGDAVAKILMLTASGAVDQRVEGLMLGADDYLAKPFAMAELTARLHALSRRAWSGGTSGSTRAGGPPAARTHRSTSPTASSRSSRS